MPHFGTYLKIKRQTDSMSQRKLFTYSFRVQTTHIMTHMRCNFWELLVHLVQCIRVKKYFLFNCNPTSNIKLAFRTIYILYNPKNEVTQSPNSLISQWKILGKHFITHSESISHNIFHWDVFMPNFFHLTVAFVTLLLKFLPIWPPFVHSNNSQNVISLYFGRDISDCC